MFDVAASFLPFADDVTLFHDIPGNDLVVQFKPESIEVKMSPFVETTVILAPSKEVVGNRLLCVLILNAHVCPKSEEVQISPL